ncbi:hypothetical protein ACFUVV_22985 [Streptomyces sp. NPDC057376]|uniref:hypothetical protein n=1 Tax=unclassified Streptomyces TaxID=2593676 RepID=UPI00116139DF|nr:hypothetical protein [Streptomyces sp. CB02414]
MAAELVLRAHDFIDACNADGMPTVAKEGFTGLWAPCTPSPAASSTSSVPPSCRTTAVRPHNVRVRFGASRVGCVPDEKPMSF